MGNFAITGGATGIGAAIRKRMMDDGHSVVVVDIQQADVVADLSNPTGRAVALAAIRERCNEGLDGFIPCAGVASQAPPKLTTSLNYYGTVELVDGLRDLLSKNNGSVLLVSSNSAPMCDHPDYIEILLEQDEAAALVCADSINGHQAYSGTKQAIVRWMRRNINEFSAQGIRINAIAPGYTQTPMTKKVEEDPAYGPAIKEFMDSIPIGRPGQPEDMANAASFLLSNQASFITGSLLFIDGGHDAMIRPDQI